MIYRRLSSPSKVIQRNSFCCDLKLFVSTITFTCSTTRSAEIVPAVVDLIQVWVVFGKFKYSDLVIKYTRLRVKINQIFDCYQKKLLRFRRRVSDDSNWTRGTGPPIMSTPTGTCKQRVHTYSHGKRRGLWNEIPWRGGLHPQSAQDG